jgi:outer membrane protein assembly factor BamB
MSSLESSRRTWIWPPTLAVVGVAVLIGWLLHHPNQQLSLRVPGADAQPGSSSLSTTNPALLGIVTQGTGRAADLPGSWPQFRGPNRDGMVNAAKMAHGWGPTGPRELWSIPVGEGYAGPAIANGCVYLMDYDATSRQDALRCLSLADGQEIWRFSYSINIKRNHGMSRTVPAVAGRHVVAIGPKCHVVCCDVLTGKLRWSLDLVREFGASVPEWYAGQCPLVDGNRVILAPGGPDALLIAADLETGKVIWQTPNPQDWKMTHSSIMPVDFAGQRLYVYCADKGVAGVSATDGRLLWQTTDWKISIATVPSPCILDNGRVFLSGGYNAGSLMLQLEEMEGGISARTKFKLSAATFGATQHTPIFHDGHIFGTRADGKFTCLSTDGKVLWTSGAGDNLGLGSYLLADGLIYALNDSGELRRIEASASGYKELVRAQVLKSARESWGPMALAGNRLLVRDLTRLACLDLGAAP